MPRLLRYTLVADGSSDECLLHPIRWVLGELGWTETDGQFADLRHIPGTERGLVKRLNAALDHYPSELVFIHRDAERDPPELRTHEIAAAVESLGRSILHVCVVPVRMSEAWLLHDELAIRTAADKPRGRAELDIPPVKRLEDLADPKSVLRDALLTASEARGREYKKKRRDFGVMRRRVAELIRDYAPLRGLAAFRCFEEDLRKVLATM